MEQLEQVVLGLIAVLIVASTLWLLLGIIAYVSIQPTEELFSFGIYVRRVLKKLRWPALIFGLSSGVMLASIASDAQEGNIAFWSLLLIPIICTVGMFAGLMWILFLNYYVSAYPIRKHFKEAQTKGND